MQLIRRDLSRKTLVGLLTIGLLLSGVVGWVLVDSRAAAWRYAAGTSTNLVTALARDIERTIDGYDLSLKAAIRAMDAPAFNDIDAVSRQQLLFDGSIDANSMGAVFVMNDKGMILFDSSAIMPRAQFFSDRDYFMVHRDHPGLGLYISKPYLSRSTGEWSIALSRRIDGPDGRFAGVVAGSIKYAYFKSIFSQLDLGPDSNISLFGRDGTMVYRTVLAESDIGRDMRDATIFDRLHRGQLAPYDGVSRVDGRERLFAFSTIGTLPLVLSVNTALSTVYADWWHKAILAGVLSLLLLGVGVLLVRAALDQQSRREQAEQATLRSNRMLRAYFEHASEALFLIDVGRDGSLRLNSVNPASERMLGLSAADAVGKQAADIYDADIAQQVELRFRTCIASGETYAYSDTRPLPGGKRDLYTVLSPIRGEDGWVAMLLGSSRDVTEQNRVQAETHQASKMEAVGRLTAGVAHDFNNYLQTIVSSLDILAADFLAGPDAQDVGAIALKAAGGAGTLVHHLMAFSRQQVLQPRRVNVANLLAETRQLAGPSVLGQGVRFKIAVEPFTDDIQVDPVQAQTCVLNLLLNASDAMPQGGSLVLHARNAEVADGCFGNLGAGRHVIIAVHDTGHGMDEDTRARAFEPFFTTKTFGKGSGLGLSMAQGFCRQSGGDIRILSGGATGTRVELWLPAASADMLAGEERGVNLALIGRSTGRVLLVEGAREVSTALAAVLVSGGFEVVAVNNAADGLMRLQDRDPYDAVLADHSLHDMTGPEFLGRVATQAPGLPLLLLSGYDAVDMAILGLPRSARVLRKPIGRSALLGAIRTTIGAGHRSMAA